MTLQGDWLCCNYELANGRTLAIRLRSCLESVRSEFQQIDVYETEAFGRMLVNDGVVMFTEWDEFCYHEMISHVPLFAHPAPRRVLVIGGGDGGALREVLRHPTVESADLCEIDPEMIAVTRRWFPAQAAAFDDPRVRLIHEDGMAFVRNPENYYDVVIVDSTDPGGIADGLFREPFFRDLFRATTDAGVVATMSETFFYQPDLLARIKRDTGKIFPHSGSYYAMVPTYPSGVLSFVICAKRHDPSAAPDPERTKPIREKLKYYSAEIHQAAFVLPEFARGLAVH
jgi:spermidine synthase